ncbi:uncharacterized protein EV154DRAFT_513076 [Mucor mucedo]|uniref:uncharacterized protein n=1 Tax=Mucor mucedo TaxID=29922 RepID=UPI00221EE631|nr:uncharacterized protein EV154DRAFT_513076 [Mucor mucedo]KAI7889842.1 hypothetical protein EV154DRAFT_513076 [Mucor mucedo]
METSTIHSFSTHAPFKQPVVITHYISMVIAFLGCYPLLLTRKIQKQKVYIASAALFFGLTGFISGYFIHQNERSTASTILNVISLLLFLLVVSQSILAIYRRLSTRQVKKIPKWIDLTLGWISLTVAFSYLTLAALVFTESCNNEQQQSQCLMPVAMGTGFIMYGTLALLHLLAIIKLPRPATPEYYEGVIITFWGFISLLVAGTPILGSEWRAINLGLLWFTGGLFSISLSVQTWIPALRERNIINALIICLTGRAIVAGLTQVGDTYAAQVHTMLGYILIIGAIARLTQIVFRKSPADNLPHRMFQQIDQDIEEEEEEQGTKCKHTFIFATITLVTGLLASLLSICGGILFMGSNVGWIRYMKFYITDATTYVNITLAVAFLWSAYVFGLCTIYKNLKASNALNQYEYLELNTSTDLPFHFEQQSRHWPISALPSSPPPPIESDFGMSLSPTNMSPIMSPLSPHNYHHHQSHETSTEKTIRPSEYRAKRRSLLVQSPKATSNNRGSIVVGGILPDELQHTATPVDSSFRRSWLSSGSNSSVGYYSGSIDSAPNSPPFEQRPYSSMSSTLPQGESSNKQQEHSRRNSANESSFDEEVKRRSDNANTHTHDMVIGNSSANKIQRWSHNELTTTKNNL